MPFPVIRVRAVSVRAYLALMVATLVLPSLVFAGLMLGRYAGVERARSSAAAQAGAVRTADAVDREIAGLEAAMQVLATSPSVALEDWAAFERQAQAVVGRVAENVLLAAPDGTLLVNIRTPEGTHQGQAGPNMPLRQVVETAAPVVSDLFTGTSARIPLISISVPVVRDARVAYILTVSIRPAELAELLASQKLPDNWTLALLDGQFRIIARAQDTDRYVGRLATGDLRANATGEQGYWAGTTLDGGAVLGAYSKLRLSAWRVAVGVPVEVLEAPLRQALWTLSVGGGVALLMSGALAWGLAREVLRPLRALANTAAALGRGEGVRPVHSRLLEVNRVGRALAGASRGLRSRADALAGEQARLAAIVETIPVGVLLAEAPSGLVVFGNAQAERIFRHPVRTGTTTAAHRDWVAHHANGLVVQPHEYPLVRALAGEEHSTLESLYQRGDGTEAWIRMDGAPIRDPAGRIVGAVVACTDIDETVRAREARARFAGELEREVADRTAELVKTNDRLREEIATRAAVEEQLRQSQKMEAVGRLTGGIAHDFNNLLTIVIGSLDLLRRRIEGERPLRLLDGAMEGAQRAATLTARLLAFSRQQPLAPQALDVNRLVEGLGDLMHRTLGEPVALRIVLDPGLWRTHADPNQLENALLNLAVNARDAMRDQDPDGRGTLTIATDNAYLDDAYARAHAEVTPGEYVLLSVADTGTGIPAELLPKVFEPFFTTKPQGQGTGLGLSQVHGFVKQSGGHIQIHSRTGPGADRGTTIQIYLPRFQSTADADAPEPAHRSGDGQGELVLVVEDEEAVRRFSVAALQELGYAVLEADGAVAALRLLDANPDVALLFTDVVLPEVNGIRLAEQARQRRPDLPVLFTTGYTREGMMRDGQDTPDPATGMDLVAKPFTLDRLAAKLRSVLDGGPRT